MWWRRIHDYPRVLYQVLQCTCSLTQWRPLSVPLTFGSKTLCTYHLQYHKFVLQEYVCDPGYLMHILWKDKPTFLYRSISAIGGSGTISMVHARESINFWGALIYAVVYDWHLCDWAWLLCNCLIGPVAWCSFLVCCWLFVTVWFKRMGCWHIFVHSPNTSSIHSFPVNNTWWPHILAYEVNRPELSGLVPLETL